MTRRYSISSIIGWFGISAVFIWAVDVFTLDLLIKHNIYSLSSMLLIRLMMGVSVFILSFIAYLIWRDKVIDMEKFAEFIDKTYPLDRSRCCKNCGSINIIIHHKPREYISCVKCGIELEARKSENNA